MKRVSLKHIIRLLMLILLIGLLFNLIPIKYSKSMREYKGYYYSTELKKVKSEDYIKVRVVLKYYTKFDLFKLNKSNEIKGELFINNTKYNIGKIYFENNKYIRSFPNDKADNKSSVIFISKDLSKVLILNYNKSYNIWCTNKNFNNVKSLERDFLNSNEWK